MNQSGTLHSFDVNNNVGELIAESERKRWNLNIVPLRRRKKAFIDFMEKYGDIDMFIHDSNHFYYWQIFEYRTVWSVLKSGGLLMSDDVDASYAFLDFNLERHIYPIFLAEGRKMFGV